MDELHHECGVAALYYLPNRSDRSAVWSGDPDQVSRHMPRMLLDLQNRGQLAAGMASYNPTRGKLLATYKDIGTVIESFRMNEPAKYASIMEDFAGRAVIGHTRYATCGPLFGAASESVALQNLGFRNIQSLEPGHLIHIRDGELSVHQFAAPRRPAHCFFEWIYFANVASTLDDRSVYLSRARLGHELARQEKALGRVPLDPEGTVVVPVPDTGKAAADAMAFALGIPSVAGVIRNRYPGRTFSEGATRADKRRRKLTPPRAVPS